jgi:hypothetical protein
MVNKVQGIASKKGKDNMVQEMEDEIQDSLDSLFQAQEENVIEPIKLVND